MFPHLLVDVDLDYREAIIKQQQKLIVTGNNPVKLIKKEKDKKKKAYRVEEFLDLFKLKSFFKLEKHLSFPSSLLFLFCHLKPAYR